MALDRDSAREFAELLGSPLARTADVVGGHLDRKPHADSRTAFLGNAAVGVCERRGTAGAHRIACMLPGGNGAVRPAWPSTFWEPPPRLEPCGKTIPCLQGVSGNGRSKHAYRFGAGDAHAPASVVHWSRPLCGRSPDPYLHAIEMGAIRWEDILRITSSIVARSSICVSR
jgi:hypothetical protein